LDAASLFLMAAMHFVSEASKYASIHLLDASSRILSRSVLWSAQAVLALSLV
jgi:hypothetical protein